MKENNNIIEIDINNKGILRVYQSDSDKIRGGISVESVSYNGEIYRRDLINEGDFVMLMNYYRYIKDNDIKDEFINTNGINSKEDLLPEEDSILGNAYE